VNGVRFGGQHDHRNVPVQTARQTAAYADGVDEPERVSVDVDDDHVDAVFGEDLERPRARVGGADAVLVSGQITATARGWRHSVGHEHRAVAGSGQRCQRRVRGGHVLSLRVSRATLSAGAIPDHQALAGARSSGAVVPAGTVTRAPRP